MLYSFRDNWEVSLCGHSAYVRGILYLGIKGIHCLLAPYAIHKKRKGTGGLPCLCWHWSGMPHSDLCTGFSCWFSFSAEKDLVQHGRSSPQNLSTATWLKASVSTQQDRDKAFLCHFPRAGKWFNYKLLRGGQRDFCTWLLLDYLMPRAFLHLLMNFTASWLLPPPSLFLVLPFLTILTSGILSFHIFWQALLVCTFSLPRCHSKILISTLQSHLQPLKLKVFFLHH